MHRFLLRFAAATLVVLATYNPSGLSYSHWVLDFEDGAAAPKALVGVLITIAWVALFTASWRSLGVIGTGLAAALVATALWALFEWAGASVSARGITYLVLVSIAFVLAVAMSWREVRSRVRARFAGGGGGGSPPAASR